MKHTCHVLSIIVMLALLAACKSAKTPESPSTSAPNQPPVTETVPSIATPTTEVIEPTPTAEIIATATETVTVSEEILASVPGDLSFIDGRKVVEMISGAEIDAATGLEVALGGNGDIVAYNLGTEGKDMWVVNPLIEKGFMWNFDKNENGQNIMHHVLEEWEYEALPIEGIKFLLPDQLPETFWDESNPAKTEEAHPWPSEGTLAVLDGNGDLLMYYSKQEGSWWYAGYQEELPGNMTFRQTSMSMALTGIRYKQVDETVWPGSGLDETWQEVRNHVDWLAYTNRTGDFISFENFSSRVKNGEVFSYQSWVFDLASGEYKLTTIDNKTKFYFETSIVDREFGNSYDGLFDGGFHGVGLEYSSGIQLNPDGSVSIIRWIFDDAVNKLKLKGRVYLSMGIRPFESYTIDFLAASDKYQKEGVSAGPEAEGFWNISPLELILNQSGRLGILHLSDPVPEGVEYELSQYTPIMYPQVENPHPYQKP